MPRVVALDGLGLGRRLELALLRGDAEGFAVPREDVDAETDLSVEEIALEANRLRRSIEGIDSAEDGVEADDAGVRCFSREGVFLLVGRAEHELRVEIVPREDGHRARTTEEGELLQLAPDGLRRRARGGIRLREERRQTRRREHAREDARVARSWSSFAARDLTLDAERFVDTSRTGGGVRETEPRKRVLSVEIGERLVLAVR